MRGTGVAHAWAVGVAATLLLGGIVEAQVKSTVTSVPEIGKVATTEPGGVLYSEQSTIEMETVLETAREATLSAPMVVTREGEQLPAGHRLRMFPAPIVGPLPPNLVKGVPMFCSMAHVEQAGMASIALGGPAWKKYLCLQDSRGSGKFDRVVARGYKIPDKIVSTAYSVAEQALRSVTSSSTFRRELLYQGVGGGVLRISYREYSDNMARSAFQQDATFDLAPSGETLLKLKGVTVRVFEAGNLGIRYVVETPFEG